MRYLPPPRGGFLFYCGMLLAAKVRTEGKMIEVYRLLRDYRKQFRRDPIGTGLITVMVIAAAVSAANQLF